MGNDDWVNRLWDDFNGGTINADLWEGIDIAGAGSSGIRSAFTGGAAEIISGGNLNDERELRMLNMFGNYKASKNFIFNVRMKVNTATTYDMRIEMYNGAQEYIKLLMGTSTANGAVSTTASGGNTDPKNITYAHDTDLHKFTIVGRSSSVKFLIDGSLKQTHTSYITATALYPRVGIKTLVAAPRGIWVDYIVLKTDRET